MMSVSVDQSTMAVNPSAAFCRARVIFTGLVSDMVVRSRGVKLTCYVEENRVLGDDIISRLNNGIL